MKMVGEKTGLLSARAWAHFIAPDFWAIVTTMLSYKRKGAF